MRILIAAPHDPLNPYIRELGRGYSEQGCEVLTGLDDFWSSRTPVDVVHVHWPELLAPVEFGASRNVRFITQRLKEWKQSAVVIATIHNSEPHVPFDGWKGVFESVYSRCDGLIHHGERSRSWFRESFPELASLPSDIIPHGNYQCFEGGFTREAAREALALDPLKRVVLVFGRTRTRDELRLVGSGLRKSRVPGVLLLLSNCLPVRRLAWFRNPMERRLLLRGVRYRLLRGCLAPEEVGLPLAAADLLLIQRQSGLNSGHVALAFSFGIPVVSADVGVFGEVVNRHENFCYSPGSVTGLSLALESAFESDLAAIGRSNRRVAETEWSWTRIAGKALEFIAGLPSR